MSTLPQNISVSVANSVQRSLLVLLLLLSLLAEGWISTSTTGLRKRGCRSQPLWMSQVSSVESTPNPSSFLIQLSAPLAGLEDMVGSLKGRTYRCSENSILTPIEIAAILNIDGVESVYAMATGLTINKKATAAWAAVLPAVLAALGDGADDENCNDLLLQGLLSSTSPQGTTAASSSGQVRIRLQISNSLPIQIEAIGYLGTAVRKQLAPKFAGCMEQLVDGGADFFAGRRWVDRGMRYLDETEVVTLLDDDDATTAQKENVEIETVLEQEWEEYNAAYSDERLAAIVAKQLGGGEKSTPSPTTARIAATSISEMDLETVQQYCDLAEQGDVKALSTLAQFVKSATAGSNMAARRNALAYLGGTGSSHPGNALVFEAVVSSLQNEKSPIMRRTAGDALSDLGDKRAIPVAVAALQDRSKLVQWRAARVLGELGDDMETCAVLKQASFSSEFAFEVAFEIKDAMRKVRERALNKDDAGVRNGGPPATGPMWKQIQEGVGGKSSSSE